MESYSNNILKEEFSVKKRRWRIIFDYDDTLIRHDTEKELRYMAEYLGFDYTEEFKKQLTSFYFNMSSWIPKGKITLRKYEGYLHQTVPLFYQKGISIEKFFRAERYKDSKISLVTDGGHELLEYLASQNYYMCILTNGFFTEQYLSLRIQGLEKYFEKVYAWDCFYAKPDERAFIRALGGTSPYENIMVGNNIEHDIVPAVKLGIYTYGVHLSEETKRLATFLPDVELGDLAELKKYL